MIANLVPLAAVLSWGWKVGDVVIVYWIENVVIGLVHAVRMAVTRPFMAGKIPLIGFFLAHYGLFCTVHGMLLVYLFPISGVDLWLVASVAAICASQTLSFLRDARSRDEITSVVQVGQMMKRPYGRIAVVHVFIIAGAFLIQVLRNPVAAIALFIVAKTALEVFLRRRERPSEIAVS